ncbi:spore Coat Protein U domain protein [Variibacter gotjawalensis]|uniref:Spore Coat Protein U domain protein n=1 Tax=Variibacter gotjawalensis TaxID=1333996 RepID=A0A0S3PT56_9BRAD|nr:spore coat U domain-containing protein [Variibacter gotjawalensis]NIK49405.1 spore coat protein U-like protein [Variibacter gotjawalensis]RZS51257.1 spore coat protein U-like protein [Variibacter gotjawalensis]BAT59090.1 spore Coat Protein U domain protein [Variibacter gotjawalensis]
MSVIRRIAMLVGVVLALCFIAAPIAQAQSCSVSITNVAFGDVDVTLNTVIDVQATVSVTCSTLLGVRVCIDIGAGTGGGTNAANRRMINGANSLNYGLFSDPGRTVPWGSSRWPAGGGTDVFIDMNSGTQTRTLYARLYAGQQTALPLLYASTFTGLEASIRYGLLSGLLGCSLLTTTSSTTFTATANVPKTCRVSAGNINFGSNGLLLTNIDQASALSSTCTNTTPYWIGLNGGLQGATNPTQRKMMKGLEFVLYGLYRDNARSLPWGSTNGTNTVSGTGSGFAQPAQIFGRVAPQATPSPGGYQDTVVATINY